MGDNLPALLTDLTLEFGEDLLMRSAVWMTLRESKSSFAIKGEADQVDRIQRFADVLARCTGQGELPLNDPSLAQLQAEILGRLTTLQRFGLRRWHCCCCPPLPLLSPSTATRVTWHRKSGLN